jgi:hypothetical protein
LPKFPSQPSRSRVKDRKEPQGLVVYDYGFETRKAIATQKLSLATQGYLEAVKERRVEDPVVILFSPRDARGAHIAEEMGLDFETVKKQGEALGAEGLDPVQCCYVARDLAMDCLGKDSPESILLGRREPAGMFAIVIVACSGVLLGVAPVPKDAG